MIPRLQATMGRAPVYRGEGFIVFEWWGKRGDYMDLLIPERGFRQGEFPWVPLFVSGGWEVKHEFSFERPRIKPFLLHRGAPLGPLAYRPGGIYRSYITKDDTVRWCVSPADENGRSLECSFYHQLVNGTSGIIRVPQGGLFVLAKGEVEINGKRMAGPKIIRAVSGDLKFQSNESVLGTSAWRKF